MKNQFIAVIAILSLAACAHTSKENQNRSQAEINKETNLSSACESFGPQTPRDIANKLGHNPVVFSVAPESAKMNLCNIHFHNAAEHKALDFSVQTKGDADGHGAGFQCNISQSLSANELSPFTGNLCSGVNPGDTIEVHWVYTSCVVDPGPGLGSCLSKKCANPNLRVETQVFTVVNDSQALDFSVYTNLIKTGNYHQPQVLPTGTGDPIEFLGSTTGPKYNEQICSPMQVTWSVRPQCAKINIASLSKWCAGNVFKEDHAHGVRALVTNPQLLSPIK